MSSEAETSLTSRPNRCGPRRLRKIKGLDRGIEYPVFVLRAYGIETFESCEGGKGHAYSEPTVRFHGNAHEGWKALTVAENHALRASALRRIWVIIDHEPTGPYWEMTFTK